MKTLIAVLLLLSIPVATEAEPPPEPPANPAPTPATDYASPLLKRICSCESTGRPDQEPQQFDSEGEVIKGKINPLDTGACQINLKYHGEAAKTLGYDLFSRDGNLGYANHLYTKQGSQPWDWSKGCWTQ